MSGLNIKKFRVSDVIINSLKEGKTPSAADLDGAISASEEGDSDG